MEIENYAGSDNQKTISKQANKDYQFNRNRFFEIQHALCPERFTDKRK
jgi:hypothetical protein